MGSIYMWTNNGNGKKYVGKSLRDVERRSYRHINGYGSVLLKRAFDKYGVDNFTFEILHDGIIDAFLNDYEIEAIRKHNSKAPHGYNLTDGGEGMLNPSKELRRKLSEAQKGRVVSEETRRKIGKAHKGKIISEVHRRKLSEAHKGNSFFKGKSHSEEARRKNSEVHKGKPSHMKGKSHTPEACRKISEALKGENHPNYGKNLSAETRRNISEAQKGRKIFC